MDKLNCYKNLVKNYLQYHSDLMNGQPVAGEEVSCVFDEQRDQYLLLKFGWVRGQRVSYTTLHVRIKDEKIWVEEDWTEDSIALELIEQGVPKSDIVLAFNPPELRSHTDFAAV